MTDAMRSLALLLVCALAAPVGAQPVLVTPLNTRTDAGPPSKTLERAIKLYDKKDFYSASIELQKVLDNESGDDERNKQRAQFFMAKTLYQMGFYAASLGVFDQIGQQGGSHTYFIASSKWMVALLRVLPATAREPLFVYATTSAIDDPINATVRDELAYQLGIVIAAHDQPAQALDMLAKSREPRAQLESARVMLRAKDFERGIPLAKSAARTPELAVEAARIVASWSHLHGVDARTALAELAGTSAYARYQSSRAQLDSTRELPGLAAVPVEAFDAVMLPSACRGKWPDDIKPIARRVLDEAEPTIEKLLAIEDNNELSEHIRRLRKQPSLPGGDVVLAVVSDPSTMALEAWLAELELELGNLQKTDKAWQVTSVAANVLQELTVQQSVAAGNLGAHARQRLKLLDEGLGALDKALAAASPAYALSAGPDGKLVVTSELCAGGGTMPAIATSKPATGCAGCATGGASGWLAALAIAMLARRARPDRSRRARARVR